jgi:hypothetical protein
MTKPVLLRTLLLVPLLLFAVNVIVVCASGGIFVESLNRGLGAGIVAHVVPRAHDVTIVERFLASKLG